MMKFRVALIAILALAIAGAASAAEIMVGDSTPGAQAADLISVSTTWTADNTYNLKDQIFVMPGATLTIEAGTLIASDTNGGDATNGGGGSLAITRGAQIMAKGTPCSPIIMTSKNDDFQTWRASANEWGNLTIMGNALVSNSFESGNKCPNGTTESTMEGLTVPSGQPASLIKYGGNDDDDDSGCVNFVSLRYGGNVIGLNNELNGMSLGGLGRATDIHHVEIMNNVDDGIEIWGGTVNLKYVSIWNIGDDSFDIDQGWRGKAQFGLIVQGYSLDASQGSGVGDNCIEMDGAEDSDAQPVTTSTIYNFTVVGNPIDGDGLTAWRDNARVQFRNCIFMDCGEKVIRFDENDGDGSNGYTGDQGGSGDPRLYSVDGTLSWVDTWTTAAGTHSSVNACGADLDAIYTVQTDGMLAEITDSVFYRNTKTEAYTEANALNIFDPANNNVQIAGFPADPMPLVAITRGPQVTVGGKGVLPVTFIDPRAANDAATSVGTAPNDGFFSPANFRGAFSPDRNWLACWTAASQYGMTTNNPEDVEYNFGDVNYDGVVNYKDISEIGANWMVNDAK